MPAYVACGEVTFLVMSVCSQGSPKWTSLNRSIHVLGGGGVEQGDLHVVGEDVTHKPIGKWAVCLQLKGFPVNLVFEMDHWYTLNPVIWWNSNVDSYVRQFW